LRPDAVLSFIDNANVVTILAAAGLGVRVVVTEQVDPRVHRIPAPWPPLRRLTYPFADLIVVVTEGMARGWAHPLFGADRVAVIPNPVVLRVDAEGPTEPGRFILAVGRLDHQKGFDTLIRAYAVAASRGLMEELVILGEGPDQQALLALAASLGVGARVRLPGRTTEIARWYRGARAFVLSSRYEGLPLALLEALAFGLPCVSTDCPTGPSDLLAGDAGVLVPVDDVARLAAAMVRVCTDTTVRLALSARGPVVAARHSLESVMPLWSSALGFEA
jgi:glycosyltransferase involved in cell wall biosynthesis